MIIRTRLKRTYGEISHCVLHCDPLCCGEKKEYAIINPLQVRNNFILNPFHHSIREIEGVMKWMSCSLFLTVILYLELCEFSRWMLRKYEVSFSKELDKVREDRHVDGNLYRPHFKNC